MIFLNYFIYPFMKKLFLLIALALGMRTHNLYAQIIPNYNDFYATPAFGAVLGSHGLGLEYLYPVLKDVDVKVGANFFPFRNFNTGYRNNRAVVNRSNANIFVDWRPFYGKESFIALKGYVSFGFSYYFENSIERYYDDQTDYYSLNFTDLAPYIGVGIKNIDFDDHFTLAFNVGYFIPLKSVEITTYNQFAENRLYDYDMLYDTWNSPGRKALIGLNANVGLYYRIF